MLELEVNQIDQIPIDIALGLCGIIKKRQAKEDITIMGDRLTLDKEWTHEELKENLYDVCMAYWQQKKVPEKYEHKALYDKDLLKDVYMAEQIEQHVIEQGKDLIEIYNEQYDKRRGENKFGICYFDEWAIKQIATLLKKNEVS